jgi:hypothetical protein
MQMEFLGFWQTFEEYSCHTHFEPTSYAYTYFLVQGNGKGTIFFEKFQYVSSKYHKYLITISTISLQKIFTDRCILVHFHMPIGTGCIGIALLGMPNIYVSKKVFAKGK